MTIVLVSAGPGISSRKDMVASMVTGSAVEIVPAEEAALVLTAGAVLVLVKEVNVQVELVMEACFFVFF